MSDEKEVHKQVLNDVQQRLGDLEKYTAENCFFAFCHSRICRFINLYKDNDMIADIAIGNDEQKKFC